MSDPVEFTETAQALLNLVDRADVEIRVTPKGLNAFARGSKIIVGRGMADEPPEMQRWSAAHEVAHFVLGHDRPPIGVLLLYGFAMIAATVMFVSGSPLVPLPTMLKVTTIAVAASCALAAMLAALLVLGWVDRPKEGAADRLAAEWGYPVTAAIAERLASHESRLSGARVMAPLRRHDRPLNRMAETETVQPHEGVRDYQRERESL